MIISILNCDKECGIGKRNGLLFSLPKDMKFFREIRYKVQKDIKDFKKIFTN